jgi:hypothetical protein
MDNLVGFKTRLDPKPKRTAAEAVELIKDVFVTAGERDIYTGDAVEICVITATGSETQVNSLQYTALHYTTLQCTAEHILMLLLCISDLMYTLMQQRMPIVQTLLCAYCVVLWHD